ncbi:MAG: hypothetical protein HYS20_00425 [Rhodocyclales bacterium]|nr:hypothetical protein [Rhodocyclales bacterium]
MQPATEDVVLRHVSVCGTAAAIDEARTPLKSALEQVVWPTTPPGELLLLRRISASGNPREIAARTAEQARRMASAAVDGWSPAAPNALAVRFRSHASLLACLIRDLLHGTAQHHWYWKHWQKTLQRPANEAIVTLLQEASLHLPAVVAQLRSTTVWQPFWHELGSSGAELLLTATTQQTGWSAAVKSASTLIASAGLVTEQTPLPQASGTQKYDLAFLAAPATDQRFLLAALLTLWEREPALLRQKTAGARLCQLSRVIAGQESFAAAQQPPDKQKTGSTLHPTENHSHSACHKHSAATAELPPVHALPPADMVGKQQTLPPFDNAAPTPESVTPIVNTSPGTICAMCAEKSGEECTHPHDIAGAAQKSADQSKHSPRIETGSQNTASAADWKSTAETISPIGPCTHGITTSQGGLFFLLNFLNLPTVQAQLPIDHTGTGWRWLHDLATALGCPPEGALLEFLASECGMKNGTELAQQPPLAAMEQLLRLGASRYGDEAWQNSSWRIPARLIASPSHIDLHFRPNDVRLTVRRVGLDINPGWLPWLGRVVTFHYGSRLEPE